MIARHVTRAATSLQLKTRNVYVNQDITLSRVFVRSVRTLSWGARRVMTREHAPSVNQVSTSKVTSVNALMEPS